LTALLGWTLREIRYFLKGVPCAAVGAFTHPFTLFSTTLLAEKFCA